MDASPENSSRSHRLPWPLALLAVCAMGALYLTSGRFVGLPIMAVVLAASYVTSARLSADRVVGLIVRGTLAASIISIVGIPREDTSQWYMKPAYTSLAGALASAEIVFRAWRKPLAARAREDRGIVLLGMAEVAGINQLDRHFAEIAEKLFRRHGQQRSAVGLSMSPRLTSVFNPEPSTSRVILIDGPLSDAHLRVGVFDTLDRRAWTLSDTSGEQRINSQPHAIIPGMLRATFTLLGDTLGILPAPLGTMAIESNGDVDRDPAGIYHGTESGDASPYTLVQYSPRDVPATMPSLDADVRERLLAMPDEVDPAVGELARHVAGEGNALTRVGRIVSHLRSTHEYSLSYQPVGEPLGDFVLHHRAAHCQYFAAATVVMARAAGVPARLATGFYAHEPYGPGRVVVRDRDAHAWAECFIDGTGWITVDATPTTGRPDALFGDAPTWQRTWEWVIDWPRTVWNWVMIPRNAWMVLGALSGASIVYLVVKAMRARRRVRLLNDDPGYAATDAELFEAAARFEQALAHAGVVVTPQRTWLDEIEATPSESRRAEWIEFVWAYDAARFGGMGSPATKRAVALLDRIDAQTQG